MMNKTQDDAFLSNYPLLRALIRKNKTEEEEEKNRKGLVNILSKCEGMEDYILLLGRYCE